MLDGGVIVNELAWCRWRRRYGSVVAADVVAAGQCDDRALVALWIDSRAEGTRAVAAAVGWGGSGWMFCNTA